LRGDKGADGAYRAGDGAGAAGDIGLVVGFSDQDAIGSVVRRRQVGPPTDTMARRPSEADALPAGRTLRRMMIETLRQGWPEQVLTGRYAFRTRRRDGFAGMLSEGARLISDDLIDPRDRRQLQIRVDNRPVMVVVQHADPNRSQAPHGPKAWSIAPPGPLITLLRRPGTAVGWRAQFEPDTYDVLDNRLGTIIGTIANTGGFVRPTRTEIYDPSRRMVGSMVEPLRSFVCRWLLLGSGVGMLRLHFVVDGRRVARIRQVWRLWAREFRVDVASAAGLLDPRLVLACGVEEFCRLSTY